MSTNLNLPALFPPLTIPPEVPSNQIPETAPPPLPPAPKRFSQKKKEISLEVRDDLEEIKFDKTFRPSDMTIRVFDDSRPISGRGYFNKTSNHEAESSGIGVIIPFFNEPNHELQQTLNSMFKSWNFLRNSSSKWKDKKLYVCLIQDGWNRADASMKEYLKLLFPVKVPCSNQYWWEYYTDFNPDATDDPSESGVDRTYVLQAKNYRAININPQIDDVIVNMKITVILKSNNRKKHNSHEWFFGKNGFAEAINAEYLFLTDAFTLYNKTCFYHLIHTLDSDTSAIAVTGRQRAMTREQQGTYESVFSLAYILRMAQLCDFEGSNAIYNGAFSLGGLLPVIPGPCGLYRSYGLLNDNMRKEYFDILNNDESKSSMIVANVSIAEDRLLTYLVVTKAIGGVYIKFNPLALFYFEAETSLLNFILQRRRWINGSVNGYIYLLFAQFSKFWEWDANFFRKIYVWILLFFQFISYMMVGIAPAISIRITYYGINYFLDFYHASISLGTFIIVGVLLWALYIIHIIIHNRSRFNYYVIYCLLALSFTTSIISVISLFHYAFIYSNLTINDVIFSGNIVVYLGIFVFLGPFVVSMMLSGRGHSTLYILKSFPAYFLFLPMLVVWFGSYAYSRLWDVSWGNRPATELGSVSEQKREEIVTKFKDKNRIVIIVLAVLNICVFFVPLEGQLVLVSVFFVTAAYQIFWSIIYCLIQITYKIGFIFTKLKNSCFKEKQPTSDTMDFV